jgi:hypothetical protein
MIKTWRNGAQGSEVKKIIDYNFNALSKALKRYTEDIDVGNWTDNNIVIPFIKHSIESPTVQLFIEDDGSFAPVLGGVKIDSEYNVILSTDLPFNGRVVIK